jgi:hypothetical protein
LTLDPPQLEAFADAIGWLRFYSLKAIMLRMRRPCLLCIETGMVSLLSFVYGVGIMLAGFVDVPQGAKMR